MADSANPILQVENLVVEFTTDDGAFRAVDGLSYKLGRGETLGIVGESGSGKSVTHLALLGLIPQPPGRISSGKAVFAGRDLLSLSDSELSQIRGRKIAMIFQDPMTSLNPFLTVEEQLTEVTIHHLGHTYEQARSHAVAMLEKVGIPKAAERIGDFPHQFSGGMRQRVMIAMALLCSPDVLIADEPTTALDVTIQAQILELLQELQRELGMAIVLITHDLGVVAKMCHRVVVMYAGRIVEEADAEKLFAQPRMPYTLGLLESVATLDHASDRLVPIAGNPPLPSQLPSGCAFHPRCPFMIEKCPEVVPPLVPRHDEGRYACLVDVRTAPRHVPEVARETK